MDNQTLLARRAEILSELSTLTRMRRGSIVRQWVEWVDSKGEKRRRGPYPLYSYKEKGRTISRRLTGPEEEKVRGEIGNFRRFEQLTQELRAIGERLCEASAASPGKKQRRSHSRGAGK